MLKTLWITFARILGFLIPSLVGSAFFFAIIGVFGIWIAIAGLLLAIVFAVTTVALFRQKETQDESESSYARPRAVRLHGELSHHLSQPCPLGLPCSLL